jgi:hypothetical protein
VLRQNCHRLAPQQRQLLPAGPLVPGRMRRHWAPPTGWHPLHSQLAVQTRSPQESPFSQVVVAPGLQVRAGQAVNAPHSFHWQVPALQVR